MKTLLKGLAVALYAAIGLYLSQSGLPVDASGWLIFAVTLAGSTIVYLGQRTFGLITTSSPLALQLKDFASALIVAVGTALVNQAATYVINGHVAWSDVWGLVSTTFIGLLTHKMAITNTQKLSLSAMENDGDSDGDADGRVSGGVGTKPK